MSHILTILIEPQPDGKAEVRYIASEGLPLKMAAIAAEATADGLREQLIELEIQRRVQAAQQADEPTG